MNTTAATRILLVLFFIVVSEIFLDAFIMNISENC